MLVSANDIHAFPFLPLQHISEILVLELGLVLHAGFITTLLIGGSVLPIAVSVGKKHVCWILISKI